MARLALHTFTRGDAGAAAELLAKRYARARQAMTFLTPSRERPEAWHDEVMATLEAAEGVTVTEDGRMLGFMLGRKETPAQNSLPNRYGVPRGGSIGMDSHAVSDDCDTLAVYMEMYAAISAEWVRQGFFAHSVGVLASDRAAHDAFVTLGFGRRMVVGVRAVEPVPPVPEGSDVYIRPATADDAEAVHLLELELDYWHSHPPMFMPVDPETNAPAWQLMESVMANPDNTIFLGLQEDEAVGMISLMRDGFIQGSLKTDGLAYLYQGIVNSDARSAGVGEALLSKALAWCKERGYSHCGLHYFSGNPVGGAFWRKHGFDAAQYGMQRIVDDRIAWARDWR